MLRKYHFLIEIAIGYGILYLINIYFVKNSPGFIGITPHPFWIIILLIASRYGILEGMVAGILAAVIYIYIGWKKEMIQFYMFTFPHGEYKLPFLFIFTGGLIGEIRNVYKNNHLKLEAKHKETINDLQDLGLMHLALVESKQSLDKRVAYQTVTMLNLFEQLNTLEALDPETLYSKVHELLVEQLNVECSSVYLMKENKLQLHSRQGQAGENTLPNTLELTEGMIGEVIKSKNVMSINQIDNETDLTEFKQIKVIMSAPIKRKDDSLIGVINIEKMPFFDFNSHSVRLFTMLCSWISTVVDKAIKFQQVKDRNIEDEITGAYNYLYFQKRLAYEYSRAHRFQSPLSLVLLEICKFNEMNEHEKNKVLFVLNWIFKNILHETEIIAKYKWDHTFVIICPGINHNSAKKVMIHLKEEIDNYEFKPFEDSDEFLQIKIGISSLHDPGETCEVLVRAAENELKDRDIFIPQ